MRKLPAGEEEISAKGNLILLPVGQVDLIGCRGEMPQLIELIVVGQMLLGDETEQIPAVQDSGDII